MTTVQPQFLICNNSSFANKLFNLLIITILTVSLQITAFGQQPYNVPFNHSFSHQDKYLYQYGSNFHTSVKPYLKSETDTIVDIDSILRIPFDSRLMNWVFNNHFIKYDKKGVQFTIDPACNFEIGKGDSSKVSWINTRGVIVRGALGNDFAFGTSFYENQARFFDYRENAVRENRVWDKEKYYVVPGQSVAKPFKETGWDYYYSDAYISYSTPKYFNIQFGTGKHFFGDGYRSLLLSDNSMNYPYLKITTDFWRIKYVNLWAQFQDIGSGKPDIDPRDKKWGAFQYLDWNVCDWLTVSLFEAIIWADKDSKGNHRGFDISYANPIIFLHPVEWNLGSPDNLLVGIAGKITIPEKTALYGQFILNEFKFKELTAGNGWYGNKWGVQAGIKSYDIFQLKNLFLQTEINAVRPFMYSHMNKVINYTHLGQPLAHPYGANFIESVSFLRYRYQRAFLELGFNYILHGRDSADANFGNNLFYNYTKKHSEYGNNFGQHEKVNVSSTTATVSYLINPKYNMNIYLGLNNRIEKSNSVTENRKLIVFGLRCSLQNHYWEYRTTPVKK